MSHPVALSTERRSRIVLLLLAGCALSAAAQPPPPFPSQLKPWALSASPALRIGAEGNPNTEFTRITGVVRMPTGENPLP